MEKEPNIAAILKEKPKGTKLWSPIFGDCEFAYICEKELEYVPIRVTKKKFGTAYFEKDGKSYKDGDCLLFPAKYMQDWSKFAWKKGDVLLCGVDNFCIFKGWDNDEYTEFEAEYVTPNYSGAILKTKDWVKVANEETIKQHISDIEEIKGGKLNLETLKIEHSEPKPKFKDGDIVVVEGKNYRFIFCIQDFTNNRYLDYYASFDKRHNILNLDHRYDTCFTEPRLATKEEKQQLFSALAKEGKRWNPETKTIEDLPKKCELEPFQKVLVRERDTDKWVAGFFSHYMESSELFYCTSGSWRQCIPYNEKTKHFLGTTDEWKGGEA